MIARYALGLLLVAGAPVAVEAQVAGTGSDTLEVVADPGDVLGSARAAQANFERRRERYFPFRYSSAGGQCDESVGRFCVHYGEGEWYPTPEPEEARALRRELLAKLDSLQALARGDGWVLGQRVWYRAEGGDWLGALVTASDCGPAPHWWCGALQGFALHGLGRYEAAERMFDEALIRMEPGLAREWRVPEWPVDSRARDVLEDGADGGPDSVATAVELLWRLADPLYLVPGNDRLTAHYARWTVATLKDGARNPYRMRWASDLAELTVRNGWEVGWERSFSRIPGGAHTVTGHHENESRDYMPTGRALQDPARAAPEDLAADRRRPRSLYQPRYAPVLLPMEGQVALFPRAGRVAVVTTHFLPEDTTFHAEHEHERPWMEAGDQARMEDRIGLFAVPVAGGSILEQRRRGTGEGALILEVPTGEYVVSAESWSPVARRAGRLRVGMEGNGAPEDAATLSDLLLLSRAPVAPGSLVASLPSALPRAEIDTGQGLAIAWEVAGLGFRPETLRFEVSVRDTDRGVFRRIGEFFGLSERAPALAVAWEEAGPETPTHYFRHLDLDLPDLDPGRYEITLRLQTVGRSDAVTTRDFRVRGS